MFCRNCGTRLADDAIFCAGCGNRVAGEVPAQLMMQPVSAQPVAEPVAIPAVEPVVAPAVEPVMEPVMEPVAAPVMEEVQIAQETAPMAQPEPVVAPVEAAAPVEAQVQQNTYTAPEQQFVPQNIYQPQQPQQMYQQAPYVQAQPKKKGNSSVLATIILVLAAIVSLGISVGHFIDGDWMMGIVNIAYFATSVILIVYNVSAKKTGSILKAILFAVTMILNIVFVGYSAIMASVDYFTGAKTGTDIYYAIIWLLQFVLLYVYMIISIIRGFMGKTKSSYATCLIGYLTALLIVAAFVVDWVSGFVGLFVLGFLPIDLGIVLMIIGDIIASVRKGKVTEEQN